MLPDTTFRKWRDFLFEVLISEVEETRSFFAKNSGFVFLDCHRLRGFLPSFWFFPRPTSKAKFSGHHRKTSSYHPNLSAKSETILENQKNLRKNQFYYKYGMQITKAQCLWFLHFQKVRRWVRQLWRNSVKVLRNVFPSGFFWWKPLVFFREEQYPVRKYLDDFLIIL